LALLLLQNSSLIRRSVFDSDSVSLAQFHIQRRNCRREQIARSISFEALPQS
jgi:hypothetical protein